jgi:hypothetical protein
MGSGASIKEEGAAKIDAACDDDLKAQLAVLSAERRARLEEAIKERAEAGGGQQPDLAGSDDDVKAAVAELTPEQFERLKAAAPKVESLPDVPEHPQECTPEDLESWRQKWTSVDSLRAAIAPGDTLLVHGDWLLEQAEKGLPLSKRQELPEGALWDPDKLVPLVYDGHIKRKDVGVYKLNPAFLEEKKIMLGIGNLDPDSVHTLGISYCWATAAHPDPNAEQLQKLKAPLRILIRDNKILDGNDEAGSAEVRLATFLDWCSLFQDPRDADQLVAFKKGLKDVNVWYSHRLTFVFALTVVPTGVVPYFERGWPRFENAVSGFIKDCESLIDLGKYNEEEHTDLSSIMLECGASIRIAPIVPAKFREILATVKFTNGSDRPFVLKKYLSTFQEVVSGATEMIFAGEGEWEETDFEFLPWCKSLQTLDLSGRVTKFPEAVLQIPTLKKLLLTMCPKLETLPESFVQLQELEELYLSDSRVIVSLPECILANKFPKLKYLGLYDDMDGSYTIPEDAVKRLLVLKEGGCIVEANDI